MEIQGTDRQIEDVVFMIAQGCFVQIDTMDIREIDPDPEERSFKAVY